MRIELPEQGAVTRVVDAYELAPMQAGMLFHALSGEGPGVYVEQVVATLREPLDADQLVRAWQRLLERHAVLRTRFRWQDVDAPLQEVLERAEIPVERLDWSGLGTGELRERFDALLVQERERGFDLAQAPLMRLVLVRTAETEHRMLWTVHHALLDGHSRVLLLRELFVLYEAFMRGTEPQLAEPRPFRDYIAWLRTLDEAAAEAHWRAALAGFHARTPLLPARAHEREPAGASGRGVHEARLPLALTDALRLRARQARITLGMLVQAAWALLLHRYTGEPEVVFGVTRAGRPRTLAGIGETLGIFINTLPVRIRIDPEAELVPWLGELRAQHAALRDHEHTPLAKVHDWSAVPRGTPLFESIVVFDSHTLDTQLRRLGEAWRGRRFEVHGETNYPLTVAAYGDQELLLQIEYSRARFTDAAAARMLGHLRTLLEAMAAPSPPRLKELPLMTAAERHQVLEAWNETAVAYPAARCVHEMFEEQARLRPEALAVAGAGRSLTYRELDQRAEALAGELRGRGVAPDTVAAIHLERSIEMLIAILAVWKAGGAYVPIDPLYPAERVRFMVEDTKAIAVLDKEGVRATWAPVRYPGSPHHLAYLIYTSGSTGQPKGVPIKHESLYNLVCWHQRAYQVTSADRATLIAGPAFDASVWEVWPYLTAGASVHIPDDLTRLDPGRLVGWLAEQGITLSFLPTALAESVLRERWPETSALRALLTGGDKLNPPPGQALPFRLVNHYGPTENTVVSTCAEVRAGGAAPPIGRPLPNTRAYVVDRHLQPVPVGVPGELLVGGAQLAAGYWNRPELTAAQFIQDPLGKPLYRTGDLVRWLPDGSLEFLGRIDHQVKIRGARVELGEIEAMIARHPGVREVVVLARDERLVAYVVGENDLRDFVSASLPEYMVPAAFIALDRLPLTPNGKVDRAALPAPAPADCAARGYEAPAGEVESALARIWADVLKLERVGRHDHFFELGGHSLAALRVLEGMRRAGLHADVRTLFATPTLAALAAAVGGDGGPVEVPPNRIPIACGAITPEMLPLVQLGAEDIARIVAAVPGGAANIQDIYPLAPLQGGILFHHRMADGRDPYVLSARFAFDSRAELNAYLQALQAVIARHDILRTAVLWEGLPEPVQVVWRHAPLPVEEGISKKERHRIDVRQAPLLRVFIERKGARWEMLLCFHHLALDHVALEIMQREIEALLAGRASELPAPLPFRNFVAQAKLGVPKEEHQAFFREMLGDVEEPTSPFGLRDVLGDGSGIGEARRAVDAQLAARLRASARALGVSTASVCHLAWALVLARASGRDDVVFGTLLFGRMQGAAGTDRALGLFINTLPVRIRLGEHCAQEGVHRAHTLLAQLLRHEHAPLALAQRCSAVAAPTPLFSALLNYRHSRGSAFLESEERTNYPLTLCVDDLGEGFALTVQAQAPVDPQRVCAFMHTALERLVGALESAPATPLRGLDVLPAAERQVLEAWNETATAYPAARCAHQLFEEQVCIRPDALAAESGAQKLSYRELDQRAEKLAWRLRRHGVQPDSLVAVYLERSVEMLVGLLAVWKAGAAYVPIDREYPAERVRFMLEDTGAPVVLTQKALAAALPASRAAILHLDVEEPGAALAPAPAASPDRLAYVIYTSGSSGVPKGVPITHRSLFNLICWHRQAYEVRPDDRATQIAGPAFDAAVWEIWPYLAAGASVHIPDDTTRLDPRLLVRWLAERRITLAFLPTPLAEAALREPWPETSVLRALLTGGDKLNPPPGQALPFRLVNHYGPTENTVVSTCAEVRGSGIPAIGRPLPNTKAYVVDRHLQPAPIGVPGELLVGGAQLSPGYWNRPDLTAAQFIQDPLGKPLYRTGDLVRWLPDGSLEFLGRIDHQVKIRGARVELGEIEAVIARHPAVRQVVVLARDERLVAYVVGENQPEELRAHLRATLPDYMMPSAFVALDKLPLTVNGKVDRKALPAPAEAADAASYVAPASEVETELAGIWAEVLGVERVGVEDDFFALGGHSLLAMQVVSRLRQALGVELPLRELFAAPVLSRLAPRIEALRAQPPPALAAPPIVAARSASGELSFSQQRMWFLDQLQPGTAAYVIPAAIEMRGRLDTPALERALAELVSRHESLRTVFLNVGGRPSQVVFEPWAWTLPLSDLSSEADPRARLAHHLREETCRAFDLASGPLFRARLYRLAADRHVLLLAMHHIISDGWSMGILARELGDLYRHGPSSLPAPLIQYRDYARWQRQWLHGDALQQLLAHWRARLAGAPQVLSLPTDRPRPAVESNRGALYSFTLPLELTEELRALAHAEGATLYMTLLAGFALLLARYSGQRDFLVGTPVANRSRPELESVVGCFVNILALRADLSGDPRTSELIARLREVCLDAFAHQELPFDRLVEELQPARDLSRNPLFQVMFALYNAPERPFELPGLALSPLEVDPGAAKVDLALHLQETPQGLAGFFEYATDLFDEATIARMAAHWRLLLEGMSAAPQRRASELPLLTEAERRSAAEWNRTRMPVFPALACVHWQIEQQAERTPDQTALIFEEKEISYRELNARANRLAWRLIGLGIGPDRLVGIRLERSLDMVVAVLAVLKAGGAYVPLDPAFPEERIRFMIEDAGLAAVLTQSDFEDLPNHGGNPITTVTAANLAYVIYTSGSTGRPKAVMVEHRNVINFFAAMDACIAHDSPGAWLATTSLSFDISVLELLWTLARGFRVVIQGDVESYFTPNGLQDGPLGFSLFMWGNDDAPGRDKYRLMLEGAKYFDRNGFEAVWTPERHFHAFGGPYPNPSVTGAALAAVTERIAIRAGSCVAPLHHPIRIAEEWAVVDNLSNGRVALAFASGWQPNDFVLRPENHARSKAVMLEQIDQVRRLWRGEKVAFRNPAGQEVAVATLPRPVQPELPLWVTTAGNPETYRQAGELGANVLTHLLGQSIDEVAEKIAIYRQARAAAGHDPASGRVTLMLHTFVGADDDEVRELVRQPMKDYLRSSLKLMLGFAWTFPSFQRPGGGGAEKPDEVDVGRLSEAEIDAVLDFAFERYFEWSGLFGSPSSCARMVERCKRAGVDEIACLLDFGVPTEQVLASLPYLNKVRSQANTKTERFSLAAQITRHGVTHLQCTPSLARMLLADGPTRAALAGIRQMLVGGEALPAALAREIAAAVGGELRNMYGPTETTVWSTTERVSGGADGVTIGRPIGNTQVYILDGFGQPLPAGVPGELAIGGAGVARGYLNQPELTELRFVDGLYRTGDVARFLPDGRIESLGRADGQIKIRGYRVELGEIESLLGEHPGVGHAAVSVHESSLVAYVVGEADFTALRAHLRRQLPDYMVPGDFVRLSRMPFTPNGKLDRKALPAPERAAAAEFVAPGTPTEEALAEMWQRILRVERIGAKDNFFESGGHSLLAVHLVGGVRERFGIELPLKHLFERPTLSELAQAIDALAWMEKSKAPARSAGAREETVF